MEGKASQRLEESAAHSNTQRERDRSRDSFLYCREDIEGKGDKKRDRRDRRRNLGS